MSSIDVPSNKSWIYPSNERITINDLRAELEAVSDAIGTTEFLDPPDGGDVPLPEQVRRMASELEQERARVRELEEALLFAERRSKKPGEGHTEFFERLADEFYQRHGYLAPGKDDPIMSVSVEEKRAAWEAFLNEVGDVRRKVLANSEKED